MKVKLQISHPYLGAINSIIEVSDKDGAGMIKNKIAIAVEEPKQPETNPETVEVKQPETVEVSNKMLKEKNVKKTQLEASKDSPKKE